VANPSRVDDAYLYDFWWEKSRDAGCPGWVFRETIERLAAIEREVERPETRRELEFRLRKEEREFQKQSLCGSWGTK